MHAAISRWMSQFRFWSSTCILSEHHAVEWAWQSSRKPCENGSCFLISSHKHHFYGIACHVQKPLSVGAAWMRRKTGRHRRVLLVWILCFGLCSDWRYVCCLQLQNKLISLSKMDLSCSSLERLHMWISQHWGLFCVALDTFNSFVQLNASQASWKVFWL